MSQLTKLCHICTNYILISLSVTMLQIPLWHKSRTKIVGTLNANVPFRASLFPPYVVYCDSVYTNIEGTRRYKNVPTILTETVDMFGSTCPVFVILPDSWPVRNFFTFNQKFWIHSGKVHKCPVFFIRPFVFFFGERFVGRPACSDL